MCLWELCCGGGGHHRHHPGPGGPPYHPGPGYAGGNALTECVCFPCNVICYFCYAFQEIAGCCCGLFDCFGYDRRPGYGPGPGGHHHGH